MQPSKEAIGEFKQIHKKEFGKELSGKEAYEMASSLLRVSLWFFICINIFLL